MEDVADDTKAGSEEGAPAAMEAGAPAAVEEVEQEEGQVPKEKTKAPRKGIRKKAETGSMLLSAQSMNCRCHPSSVSEVLHKIRPTIDEATWHELELLNLVHFFDLPPYPQNHILTMHIINCWHIDRRAFILGGKEIKFDADKIALLIGMPNRGAPATWCNTPSASMDSRQIKTALLSSSPGESSRSFVQLLIKFLMSNLLFPSKNFRVSNPMCNICDNIEGFSSYNWPATVCRSLTEELNESALKIRKDERVRYVSGFVFLLTLWFYEHTTVVLPVIPDARPRMLRWPAKARWNATKVQQVFEMLSPAEVYDVFVDLKDSEHCLLGQLPQEPTSPSKPIPEPGTQSRTQSPAYVEFATSFPHHADSQPTDGDTYPQSALRSDLQELTELLKSHHRIFLDFQCSMQSRLANCEQKLTELKSDVAVMKKSRIQPSHEFVKKWSKVSPQRSLIERIKAREDRRKRTLRSPFMVFERKKKSQKTNDVGESEALKKRQCIELDPVQSGVDEPEAAKKVDFPPTISIIHIESQDNDDQSPAKVITAARVLDFPARLQIPDFMRDTIDACCSKFTGLGDFVIDMGNVSMTRRYLDELLTNGWIGNDHVDSFALMLENRRSNAPHLYRSYLYVSPCHWLYRVGNVKRYVEHITKEAVQSAEILMIPILNNQHWTLLVATMNECKWRLYDSLRSKLHVEITRDIIAHLLKDVGDAFTTGISEWPVLMPKNIPSQSNSFDCGVFVCKYMETIIQKGRIDWKDKLAWQQSMTIFRAEIAYELCQFSLSRSPPLR